MNDIKNILNQHSENSMLEDLNPIFEASAAATKTVYTNGFGQVYEEEPGGYNSRMTIAIAMDMISKGLVEHGIREAGEWSVRLRALDENLMRISDDKKAGRTLLAFDHESANTLLASMVEVKASPELSDAAKDLIHFWISRVTYLCHYEFVLTSLEDIRIDRMKAGTRIYDNDANLIEGLTESDEITVNILLTMKKILLQVMLRIPALSTDVDVLINRIENLDIAVSAVMDGKVEELSYLAKCAEAAKEFGEEPVE